MIACPNYKSKDWNNLLRHYKNSGLSNEEAEIEATRVFLANDSNLPSVESLTEIKKFIKFQSSGISSLKKSKMLVALSQYNKHHNSSHRIDFVASTPTSYKAKLILNFMPKTLAYELPSDMNKKVGSYSGAELNTLEDPDIYIGNNNEYVVDGEVFPSYEDAKNSMMYQKRTGSRNKAIKELDEFLKNYLSRHGIKVEYINNFMEKFKMDAVAVSDMSTKMISVAKGREDSTTLPEEAAHFIIELLGKDHSLYKAMESIIEDTSEYKEVVDEYSKTYNNNKEMLRKEAMGKIFAKYIIKRYNNKQELPIRTKNLLGKIFDWFKNKFSNLSSAIIEEKKDAIFKEAANKLFDDSIELKSSNLIGNKSVFAQTDDLVKALNKSIEKLERKSKIYKEVGTRGEEHGRAEEIAEYIDITTQHMGINIQSKEYAKAISIYLDYIVKNELNYYLDEVKKYYAGEDIKFSFTQVNEMIDLVNMYQDTVSNLKEVLTDNAYYSSVYTASLPDTKVTIKDMINETLLKISDVKTFAEKQHKNKVIEIVEQVKPEASEYDANELLESAVGDLNFIQLNFGSLRNANDEALRMVYKMVWDIHNNTHFETLEKGKSLMDLQLELEKTGVETKAIHETYNGKKTGFIISKENWGEYYIKREEVRNKIAKELGHESYSDIDFSEANNAEVEKYYKRYIELFRRKYEKETNEGWIPMPPKNVEFEKLMKNEAFKNYYNAFTLMMKEARGYLPSKYRSSKSTQLMMPQIRKDMMQTLKDKEGAILKQIGSRMVESFVTTEDDTEFGTTALDNSGAIRDVNGNIAKLVPVHYVTKIKNTNDLSNDATSMAVKFYEMAANFGNASKDIDKLLIIQRAIGNRTFESKNGKDGGTGLESNAYKALDQFLDSFIYGKFKDKWEFKIPGTNKVVNATKIADKLANFVRANNLFMNIPTTISGYTKAGIDSFIDKVVGNYTSIESSLWAEKEFDLHLSDILSNIGKRKKSGKVPLMFEYNGIFSDISETFHRLDHKSRFGRATSDDLIYSTYAIADVRIKGKLALSVYDNYRLVDGKFISKNQFKRKYGTTNKKWSDYKGTTLYDAYEVKNGKFQVKPEYSKIVTTELRNTVRSIIKQRGSAIDGQLTQLDRPAIMKSVMGRYIMLHRGWLVSGLSERWKKKGINYTTGEIEEGFYRSFAKTVGTMLTTKGNIKQKISVWNTLDDFQKMNTIKTLLDLSFSALVIGMSVVVNALVDDNDEDDWWIQYLGYQMSRIRLEQVALTSPTEFASILNSPTAMTNLTDTIGSFFKLATDWDKIEYGAYEDMYRIQRAMIKNSLLKNLWELQAPEQKNKFLRSQVL